MILRDYQNDAIEGAMEQLRRNPATLLVMPTGTGKTIVFAELIRRFLPTGRAMVIAHREELLDQARAKIAAVTGIMPDLEMAEFRANEAGMFQSPIVVSSIQTQIAGNNGGRMKRFDPSLFNILIIDEAHHATADTYRRVIEHYQTNPELKVIGVTATPDRHDEEALGQIFDTVGFDFEIVDAIHEGWLVPIKQHFLDVVIDFAGVQVTLGDFNGKHLRELLAQGTTLEEIARQTVVWSEERKTLVFADSVVNAEEIVKHLNRHREGCAKIVTGETNRDERRSLIEAYRAGSFQYLVNVGVATEGFDVPDIACVCMARPTLSRSLYTQMAGRGTRPLAGTVDGVASAEIRRERIAVSGKPDLLILDIVGNSKKHKLIHAGDILGGRYDDDVVARAEDIMRESGMPMDVAESLEEAQRRTNAELEAEAKRLAALKLKPKARSFEIDPFARMGIVARSERGWEHGKPMTGEQAEKLKKWKLYDKSLTYSEAQQVIDEFRSRVRRGLCTPTQAVWLVRRGGMTEEAALKMSYEAAHAKLDTLFAR